MTGYASIPWVRKKISASGIHFNYLDSPEVGNNIDEILGAGASADNSWAVLDGYHFTVKAQNTVREGGFKLLVIDDYAHLNEYSCDLLLNQNFGSQALEYHGQIGRLFTGPEFALLRPEFAKAETNRNAGGKKSVKILINFGGGDSSPYLEKIAVELAQLDLSQYELDIIGGATSESWIRKCFAPLSSKLNLHSYIDNMATLLETVDICITAGGSTCWEICRMGVPMLIFSIAANQDDICRNMIAQGYALEFCTDNLSDLLASRSLWKKLSEKQRALVPGDGAVSILELLEEKGISIVPANLRDSDEILAMVNSPDLRAHASSIEPVPVEEHREWYRKKMTDGLPFLVAKGGWGTLMGYVRFKEEEARIFSVSIALKNKYRRQGIGSALLKEGIRRLKASVQPEIIKAFILRNNTPSQRLFSHLGFRLVDIYAANPDLLEYSLRVESIR